MSNTGGAITLRDDQLAASCRQELVVTEGLEQARAAHLVAAA